MTRLLAIAALAVLMPAAAHAQNGRFAVRGFGEVGATVFTAAESFAAILGSRTGPVFGGGIEVVLPQRVFVGMRASHFRKTGERVFISNGERFGLGIPTTVTLTPLQITGGYRFRPVIGLTPYAGAGPGWYRYTETSELAAGDEDVNERFSGFHILGGAEVEVARRLSLGGELLWATVPNAIGKDANSVAREFRESDLGGTTVRLKVVIGM